MSDSATIPPVAVEDNDYTVYDIDRHRKWLVLSAVGTAIFMATLDASIVNIALPTLQKSLNASFALIQWVILAYLLGITGVVLVFARLGDMIGKKRLYNVGFVAFTLTSALCGLAPNIEFLIFFRALQGVSGSILQALGIAIITETFLPRERGKVLGITGTLVSVGIAAGPIIGGMLIHYVGWRGIFWVNVPIGTIGAYLCWRYVPDIRPRGRQPFDFVGAALLTGIFLSFALGMTFGQEMGFDHLVVLLALSASFIVLLVFISVELRIPYPIINLRLFRKPLLSVGMYTAVAVFIVLPGVVIFPFYLENVKGYPINQVGLLLAAFPVALGISAPVSGMLSDRLGTRVIALIGLIITFVACLSISTVTEDTSLFGAGWRVMLLGAGIGFFQSPNNSAIMGAAPKNQLGVVSGLLATTRNVGQVAGLPMLSTIFALRAADLKNTDKLDISQAPDYAIVGGLQAAYLFAAAVILSAILVAIWGIWMERVATTHRNSPNQQSLPLEMAILD